MSMENGLEALAGLVRPERGGVNPALIVSKPGLNLGRFGGRLWRTRGAM